MRMVNASRSQPMKESMVVCNCALGHLCVKATRAPSACGCTPLLWVVRVITWARKKNTRVGQGIPPQQANTILHDFAHSCEMVSRIFSMLQEKKRVTFFEGQAWILWYEGLWWTHPHLPQRKNKTHTHVSFEVESAFCVHWEVKTVGKSKMLINWARHHESARCPQKTHTTPLQVYTWHTARSFYIWRFRSKRTCGSK